MGCTCALQGLLSFLYIVCVTSQTVCDAGQSAFCSGKIVPTFDQLPLGKELTATCVLSETIRKDHSVKADDIYWQFGNVTVPKAFQTKVNESASRIIVNITKELQSPLKCNVKSSVIHGFHRNVDGVFFEVGYPPERPKLLTCLVPQDNNDVSGKMKCNWDPGVTDPIVNTTYWLMVKTPDNSGPLQTAASRNGGELQFPTIMPIFSTIHVWVEVENKLGKAASDVLTTDPIYLLKVNPPKTIQVISEQQFCTSLLLKWANPVKRQLTSLNYNIRYSAVGGSEWSEVPLTDTLGDIESFRLQSLDPYTDYVVQIRCRSNRGFKYWGDWSSNATGRTCEVAPSRKPDLWRLFPFQSNGETYVKLLWKEPVNANGKILGYTIVVDGKEFQINSTSKLEYLVADARRINLTVYNSAGRSPAAILTLNNDAFGLTNRVPVDNVSCTAEDDRLWVSWDVKRSRRPPSEYVLEWVSVISGEMDWQREPASSRRAALRGNVQPYQRYNISVYPLYQTDPGKPYTVQAYLQEGAPSEGPSVKLELTGKNNVELSWPEIPISQQNGFITGYTIFYKGSGPEKSISLLPENRAHVLGNLSSNTKYELRIMATTKGGSTNGTELTFHTSKYGAGEIEAIVVVVCITFLLLTVLTVAICINKKKMLQKHIWPQVPDPSNSTIANWSPDVPRRPDSPKDGSMTDVSVVEVSMFDTKSMGDEDKASPQLKKDKNVLEDQSSGIGGSSCMSSPRQSVSDSDEGDSGQTTNNTVQYSVVGSGYKGQTPAAVPPAFARSESTQPLLEGEERPEEHYPRRPLQVNPVTLFQIEGAENSFGSLGFCSMEEESQQTTPTGESQLLEGVVESSTCYMAQSGYRPQ